MTKPRLILNRIKTPDGTILTSYTRHDYKEYTDANGCEYMVDGGLDYLRRTFHVNAPCEELSLYEDAPWEDIRMAVTWGTYGKGGDNPYRKVMIKDMSDAHLEAIISDGYQGIYVEMMGLELIYREEKGIIIED